MCECPDEGDDPAEDRPAQQQVRRGVGIALVTVLGYQAGDEIERDKENDKEETAD